ncbi:hypothetical protein IU450_37680 [Nocardia abscessus]|uniref:hypothetical protein n=1 Tax=Nocardia abscessus TaxID=120957 RepID=UPI0018943385|nr:hypothetical protein [Nocardia abscessus]MBF6341568.1 hypothetical protein [Nocardia abscessus]
MSDPRGEFIVPGLSSPLPPSWPESDELDMLPPDALLSPDVTEVDYTTWLPHPAPTTSTTEASKPPEPIARTSTDRTRPRSRRRLVVALLSICGPAVIIGIGIWGWPADTAPQSQSPLTGAASPPTAAPPASSVAPGAWCVQRAGADRVSGSGAGSTASGPEVILALEYSYYTRRDATVVRTLLAPEGRFGSDAEIQAGIDAVPTGTTHCVDITPAGPDRWSVTVTERWPNDSRTVHRQTISTTTRDTRTLVVAVEPA